MTAAETARYENDVRTGSGERHPVAIPEGKAAIARNLTPAQQRAVMYAKQQVLRARAARKAKDDREAARSRMWANADRDGHVDSVNAAERSRMVCARGDGQISLRKISGEVLRNLRTKDHRTLREVSGKAGVSLGYLSEVERGQKEASSELLVSITQALGVRLSDMLMMVADRVRQIEAQS